MVERFPALGNPLDGTLAEHIVLHEDGVVAIPPSISFEEAATLPCAAVTAWNALMVSGKPVKSGDTVLCLGTGGVAIAGLQFAKAAGARVIVTSSSDEKIKRACILGASDGVNYKRFPDWEKEVIRLTGGRGADHIIENGGAGSLNRSFEATAFGGKVALIGFLAGVKGDINPAILMMKSGSMVGIGVGSRAMFEDMNRAIEVNKIKPVVDKVFPFEQGRRRVPLPGVRRFCRQGRHHGLTLELIAAASLGGMGLSLHRTRWTFWRISSSGQAVARRAIGQERLRHHSGPQ